MAMSDSHKAQLDQDLMDHETRLQGVRQEIEILKSEERFHEIVLSLGRDIALLAALDELHDEPHNLALLIEDVDGYVERAGLNLPPDAKVTVANSDPDEFRLEVHLVEEPFRFTVVADAARGFAVIPTTEDDTLPRPPTVASSQHTRASQD
jgi:hypothetical protein